MTTTKLYRAKVHNYAEDHIQPKFILDIEEYDIIRKTECFFIIMVNGKEKRIGINARASFATHTKEKALIDAFQRNRMHRAILNARLEYAKKVRDFLNLQIQNNHE